MLILLLHESSATGSNIMTSAQGFVEMGSSVVKKKRPMPVVGMRRLKNWVEARLLLLAAAQNQSESTETKKGSRGWLGDGGGDRQAVQSMCVGTRFDANVEAAS